MKVTVKEHIIEVEREATDPKYYGGGWGDGESKFLYHLKDVLNAEPFNMNLIKKRMWKDGHLVDDEQQYLRSRKLTDTEGVMIFNDHWAITGLNDDFNKEGKAYLRIERMYRA